MGICYLNQFTFHGFINIQVRASEINIRVTDKINSMLSGNADNEVSRFLINDLNKCITSDTKIS